MVLNLYRYAGLGCYRCDNDWCGRDWYQVVYITWVHRHRPWPFSIIYGCSLWPLYIHALFICSVLLIDMPWKMKLLCLLFWQCFLFSGIPEMPISMITVLMFTVNMVWLVLSWLNTECFEAANLVWVAWILLCLTDQSGKLRCMYSVIFVVSEKKLWCLGGYSIFFFFNIFCLFIFFFF